MRGGIFPGRAKFYRVPAVSRHGGTVTALLRLAKCSLVNKLVWTSQAKDLSFLKRTANMQFWRIFNPDYESDYQHSYINGGLEHPFGMPGIECDVCHQTWGGGRILPLNCPASLRNHKNIKEGWAISREQHRALQSEVQDEFRKIGISCPPLQPEDAFQPCYLDVPSKPKADFLWASGRSLVGSKRIKDLFHALEVKEVAFCPINLHKIGKRNARLPAPIPPTGEPEDIIEEMPMLARTDSIGPYFEVIVKSKAGYAPGGEPLSTCSCCGRETFPETDNRFVMVDSMWKGADIFFAGGMLQVTDRLKLALQNLKATNVQFQILQAFS
jgi:hypothetical protein